MSGIFVDISHISKSYGSIKALDDINISINSGEIFGLIGPDGAGKSTLIRILITLLLPDSGTAKINNLDIVKDFRHLRKMIGYMPGTFSLYEDLTIKENLDFFATIFNTTIEENYHLVKDIYSQIEPFKNRRAGKLSGGMKQKLALSCALIHKPDILVLDEPTTGVDAVSRMELWEMLGKLRDQGLTIIVSTPFMNEAKMCDRVALMQKGKVMEINTPAIIESEFNDNIYAVMGDDFYGLLNTLRSLSITKSAYFFGTSIHLTTKVWVDMKKLKAMIDAASGQNTNIEQIQANIEDCFMDKMIER